MLDGEYLAVAEGFGLGRGEIAELAANAVRASFLDVERKAALVGEIRASVDPVELGSGGDA